MKNKAALYLRTLLNRYHEGSADTLLAFLPEEEKNSVANINTTCEEPSQALRSAAERMSPIHLSWFEPILESIPADIRPFFVASMPESHASVYCSTREIPQKQLPLFIKDYFATKLLQKLQGAEEVLPNAFLPVTSFHQLTSFNRTQLTSLIMCLSIHDLSEELRHIVDQKILKAVYDCLTPGEQQYLRYCMHQKEKLVLPRLGLDRWNGDCQKLKHVLHSRGILRLGKGLSGEHPYFLWHLAHRFDRARGVYLMKNYQPKSIPGISPLLAQQVVNIINNVIKKDKV